MGADDKDTATLIDTIETVVGIIDTTIEMHLYHPLPLYYLYHTLVREQEQIEGSGH